MDNMEDSELNAKTADSAYSNSCSNSQSRRSHSSKSTRSGSSGSSGYCGKPSTPGTSNNVEQTSKKDKNAKKRKLSHADAKELSALLECKPPEPETDAGPNEEKHKDMGATAQPASQEYATETLETPATERKSPTPSHTGIFPILPYVHFDTSCDELIGDSSGFSCAVCMHDGVIMYTTHSLTATLGYPKEMWIGRSFIDFIHPQDRATLSTQIINGLAVPSYFMNYVAEITKCTMACRIRQYRSLRNGFEVFQKVATYKPFYLSFSFKEMLEDNVKVIYLIIKAIPINSNYTTPNESVVNPTPFVIKHSAAGLIDYADVECVPYLGYLPQDIHTRDALLMYHPDDLPYLKSIYEQIVKEGTVAKSRPYRMQTNNGDYIKLATEWSSFINPWSMKLEFVFGKHYVIQGPKKPNVFLAPPPPLPPSSKEETIPETEVLLIQKAISGREEILKTLNKVLTKPAEKVRQQISKRCHDITQIMESLLADMPKEKEDPNDAAYVATLYYRNAYERDSVMLGGISPHHDSDSKSSTGTPLSYTQLNYNENLQRYFDSHQNLRFEEKPPPFVEEVNLKSVLSAHIRAATPMDLSVDLSVDAGANVDADVNVDANVDVNVDVNVDAENELSNQQSGNSSSPCESMMPPQCVRLTETLLHKHNNDMEKELAKSRKIHREIRNPKFDRSCDTRQKKKEHLDRCNAVYQPNQAVAPIGDIQHGLKRTLSIVDEVMQQCSNKQQCTESRKAQLDENSPDAEVTDATAEMKEMPSYTDEAHTSSQYPMGVPKSPVTVGPWMISPHIYISPYSYPEHAQTSYTSPPPNIRRSFDSLDLTTSNYTQTTESFGGPKFRKNSKSNPSTQSGLNSDETFDKTDGESSYSSFYSSFFRTESGSGTDSMAKKSSKASKSSKSSLSKHKPVPPKKPAPQWMEPATPEVMFKYQIKIPPKEAVLKANLEKIRKLQQPALVTEQLGQLYSQLQLEGKAARLTLEEAITSSCSSGEESNSNFIKPLAGRSAHELSMIYEEDAPLPPPDVVVVPELEAIANESTQS